MGRIAPIGRLPDTGVDVQAQLLLDADFGAAGVNLGYSPLFGVALKRGLAVGLVNVRALIEGIADANALGISVLLEREVSTVLLGSARVLPPGGSR